jgi:hypothetical protein
MQMRSCAVRFIAFIAALLAGTAATAADFETPVVLSASRVLPADLVRGPNFKVDEKVTNDGFLNVYTINSSLGTVQATSTMTLRKYIGEIEAAARMSELRGSEEFAAGIKEKAGQVVEGAKGLVTDPAGTLSGAASGVGKLFSRAGENMFGGSRSQAEESRMEDLLGYSKAKRDYAYEFGVDAYSRNPVLQKELDEISRAGFMGNLTASAALMMVPGGAGVAVSATGGTQLMNNVFRDAAPADLRIRNRDALKKMGVAQDVSDLFIANSWYTPREQTLLVEALASMQGTKGRDQFIKLAVLTEDPDLTAFRQRQAQMYAGYHASVEPVSAFVPIGQFAAARTTSGKVVFALPVDYLLWTQGFAAAASSITNEVSLMKGVKDRELWVSGTLSPKAKESIGKMGWKVSEKAEVLLKGALL